MNKLLLKLSVIIFSSLILLLTIGCYPSPVKENQDKNIITIKSVLENTFTGPDKEFQDIMENVDNETGDALTESLATFSQYIEDLFKPYFANEHYKEYVNMYGSTFLEKAYRSNHQLRVNDIDYEKVDSDEDIYNFTFKIQYKKEENEQWETDTVKGQANLDDNHNIKRMLMRNLEFLNNLK